MPPRILTLTYPLMPLSWNACGGVEQVAHTLLHRLATMSANLELTTIADASSHVPGKLLACDQEQDDGPQAAELRLRRRERIALARGEEFACHADLIHLQGFTQWRPVAAWGRPTLLTLHMAFSLYPAGWLIGLPENLHLLCISHWQANQLAQSPGLAQHFDNAEPAQPSAETVLPDWIGNGIELDRFEWRLPRADFLLYLGRICPEKGTHLAIKLARMMKRRLVLAGDVYPFPSHQEYFQNKIAPWLCADVQWLQSPPLARKRELLARAAAVIICTQVEEPSSLTAMEAAASGAPVLALRRGALEEIVAQEESGILADDLDGLRAGAARLRAIQPGHCRRRAERLFSAAEMAASYFRLYQRLASGHALRIQHSNMRSYMKAG